MAIMKVRDENGNFIDIPSIKGEPGDDGLSVSINVNGNTYSHTNGIITLPDYPSLTNYATKDELPTKVSQLINDSGFLVSISSGDIVKANEKGLFS